MPNIPPARKALLFYNLPATFPKEMIRELVMNIEGARASSVTVEHVTVGGQPVTVGKVLFNGDAYGESAAEYFLNQQLQTGKALQLGDNSVWVHYGYAAGNGLRYFN